MANFTKQAIETAFLQLLNEKPLNKISVRDIVEKCGINRNSFYYHFQDIPSLIAEIITASTDRLIEEYPTISTLDECCEMAFRYALRNRSAVMHDIVAHFTALYALLCEGRGAELHHRYTQRRHHLH